MSLIRLLDISGIFWPIWRAKEGAGRPIGEAAAETVQTLRERAAAGDVDHVVACCDTGRSFRHEIALEYRAMFPEYKGHKAHRPEKDPAMMACLDRVIDELEQDGVPIMRAPGFEADDVIATLTAWAHMSGHDVEIVSEDKDLLQLVRDTDPDGGGQPGVAVVRRDGTRQGYNACVERMGVPPGLVSHLLALAGDKSDGVLGVPNIGKDSAARLLWGRFVDGQWKPTPFRSFAAIVEAAVADQAAVEQSERERAEAREKKIRPLPTEYRPRFAKDVRQSLFQYGAAYDIGLRLTTLRTDVPLDFAAVTAPRTPKPKADKTTMIDPELRTIFDKMPENTNQENDTVNPTTDAEVLPPSDQLQPAAPASVTAPSSLKPQAIEVTATKPDASLAVVQAQALAAQSPDRDFERQLEPANFVQAMKLAEKLAEARMFKDIGDAAQAFVKMAVGRSIKLNLMQSLTMLHVMEGKITMAAQMVLARCKTHPDCEYFRRVTGDTTHAEWETKRKGEPPQRWRFTIEDAKRAKLGGSHKADNRGSFAPDSNWAKYPQQMCSWRAVMFLAREVFPEVAAGIYDPDEIREQRDTPSLGDAA